jgi:hypothetical protein
MGAEQEYGMVKIKSALTGIAGGEIMVKNFRVAIVMLFPSFVADAW